MRNEMLYAKLHHLPPTLTEIGHKLRAQLKARAASHGDAYRFLLTRKLGVGWGTLRVGAGMALSRQIYEAVRNW